MNTPKNHHYVPESYLNRFTDSSGRLHVRDMARNQQRHQRPTEVMTIGRYYRQTWAPTGIDPNILENGLASGIENDIKPIIDCLIQSPDDLTDYYAAVFGDGYSGTDHEYFPHKPTRRRTTTTDLS